VLAEIAGICGSLRLRPAGCVRDAIVVCAVNRSAYAWLVRQGCRLEALVDRQADRARGLVKNRVVLPGDGFSSTIPLASRESHGIFDQSDARPSPTCAPRDRDPALTRVVRA
jgi:hypothetical protein